MKSLMRAAAMAALVHACGLTGCDSGDGGTSPAPDTAGSSDSAGDTTAEPGGSDVGVADTQADTQVADTQSDTTADAQSDTTADAQSDTTADTGSEADTTGDAEEDSDAHVEEAHWSYEGESGPEHWGDLSPKWETCGTGTHQSPIDITAVSPSTHPEMNFDWKPSKAMVLNNGHTVQFNYEPGSTFEVDGKSVELQQFHYHAHSEHTVSGESFPLELHFVHKDVDGKLAVVGILVESGEALPALDAIADNLPETEQEETEVPGVTIDAAALLPSVHASWRYEGSLTTPDCAEGVEWFVMSQPIEASPDQIAKFTNVYDHNFRPTQPLNGRKVEGPHWAYEGETGPDHWAQLSPDFEACLAGMQQSPIDIPLEIVTPDVPETFSAAYASSQLEIVNNGHTVQVNYEPGSTLTLEAGTYELQQFHFHAQSEHLLSGNHFPLEIHFVHKGEDGALAVVGVLVDKGLANDQLSAILPHLPATEAPATVIPDTTVFASGLMPAFAESWRYDGSLTTPPCSEGVSWTVLATPISASPEQIEALTEVLHDNFRPAQPLAGRLINGVDANGPPM